MITVSDLSSKQTQLLLAIPKFTWYRGEKGFYRNYGTKKRWLRWILLNPLHRRGLIETRHTNKGPYILALTAEGFRLVNTIRQTTASGTAKPLYDRASKQFLLDV